jgi:hypothetical protein
MLSNIGLDTFENSAVHYSDVDAVGQSIAKVYVPSVECSVAHLTQFDIKIDRIPLINTNPFDTDNVNAVY